MFQMDHVFNILYTTGSATDDVQQLGYIVMESYTNNDFYSCWYLELAFDVELGVAKRGNRYHK